MRFEPSAKNGNTDHKLTCFFHPEQDPENKIKKSENCTSAYTLYHRIHGSLCGKKTAVQNGHHPFRCDTGNTAENQSFEKHPEQFAEMENLKRILDRGTCLIYRNQQTMKGGDAHEKIV